MKRAEIPAPIRAIEVMLAGRIGLDTSTVSPNLVSRAVRSRMAALGLTELTDYETRLRGSPTEVQELIEEVVIPESWFFRDVLPFQFLRDFAWSRLSASPAAGPLRVLSLPCARGEEPLSVAMSLRDAGIDPRRFQIDGVDVGERNLEFARRGCYSRNAFRGTDLGFRDRYFRPRGAGFEVDPALGSSIRYLRAAILDPGLLRGEPPYDIILCRNLLIYLTPEARARSLTTLGRLLAKDGILILGHADHLGQAVASAFVQVGDPACFAFRKVEAVPNASDGRRGITQPIEAVRPRSESLGSFPLIRRDPPPPPPAVPAPTVASVPVPVPVPIPASKVEPSPLEQAAELANQGRTDEAIELVEKQLRTKGPNAAGFYLLGILAQAVGDRERAERYFLKAVYLDPRHDEALLALALFAERRGDASAASAYRRRAERALSAKEVS
jgi:chemotaxis protein methyltransferase WspC